MRLATFSKSVLISSVLWLSACTIFPEDPPKTRYQLPSAAIQALPLTQQLSSTLYVSPPQANRLINSRHILVQPEGTEVQAYKGAQWADTVPALLQERLINALNEAQLFKAVSPDAGIITPYALQGYVSHFEVLQQGEQPVVRVQYTAQLIDREQSRIQHSQHFHIQKSAHSLAIDAIVHAFGAATDQLSEELVQWLAEQAN